MNIQKMMQQAQEMQGKLQEMQEKIGTQEVTGLAGGGLVKVVMQCRGTVVSVNIDPSLLKAEEKEIVEDLVAAACNDARARADAALADATRKMMEDLGLPAGTQLPF